MSDIKEIFVDVELDGKVRPYLVSNLGRVYSRKSERFVIGAKFPNGTSSIYICSGKYKRHIMLHTLVSLHFNEHTQHQDSAQHLNFINEDNEARNLEPCTVSERMTRTRARNAKLAGKTLGVYPYPRNAHRKWRAVLKDKKGKINTIGYYKTMEEAKEAFRQAYLKRWGFDPY